MAAKFIQINCREIRRVDLRRARAVLTYRPDIVLFEMPASPHTTDMVFNRYAPDKKPLNELRKILRRLRFVAKEMLIARSFAAVWESIAALWREEHQVLVYNIDAPADVYHEFYTNGVWTNMYPCAMKNWLWWVRILLRERYMAAHVREIMKRYTAKKNPTVLVCVEKFHWVHVKFLLSDPSKEQIWKFYFGRFSGITPSNIAKKIKKGNNVFYKHWKEVSGFY